MLQAALHVESDLVQHMSARSSATGSILNTNRSTLNNQIHAKASSVEQAEQLYNRHDSVRVNKMSNARVQCREDITPVSTTDTMQVVVAPATAFCLSQDDFDDDIDDLSFIDLPLHSESSHGSLLSTVTSDCHKAAVSEKNLSLVNDDVISKHRHVQLQNNNALKRCEVNCMQLAQKETNSSATAVDFIHRNGKYFTKLLFLHLAYGVAKFMANY